MRLAFTFAASLFITSIRISSITIYLQHPLFHHHCSHLMHMFCRSHPAPTPKKTCQCHKCILSARTLIFHFFGFALSPFMSLGPNYTGTFHKWQQKNACSIEISGELVKFCVLLQFMFKKYRIIFYLIKRCLGAANAFTCVLFFSQVHQFL